MAKRNFSCADLGSAIASARDKAGLTQEQLAEACGVHQMTVSAWERGLRAPGAMELRAVARATKVSADALLGL
jgi:transcriptional regulator with XRE-family HTH domain